MITKIKWTPSTSRQSFISLSNSLTTWTRFSNSTLHISIPLTLLPPLYSQQITSPLSSQIRATKGKFLPASVFANLPTVILLPIYSTMYWVPTMCWGYINEAYKEKSLPPPGLRPYILMGKVRNKWYDDLESSKYYGEEWKFIGSCWLRNNILNRVVIELMTFEQTLEGDERVSGMGVWRGVFLAKEIARENV